MKKKIAPNVGECQATLEREGRKVRQVYLAMMLMKLDVTVLILIV